MSASVIIIIEWQLLFIWKTPNFVMISIKILKDVTSGAPYNMKNAGTVLSTLKPRLLYIVWLCCILSTSLLSVIILIAYGWVYAGFDMGGGAEGGTYSELGGVSCRKATCLLGISF